MFHSPGPAAKKALLPNVLYVCVTTHVQCERPLFKNMQTRVYWNPDSYEYEYERTLTAIQIASEYVI